MINILHSFGYALAAFMLSAFVLLIWFSYVGGKAKSDSSNIKNFAKLIVLFSTVIATATFFITL